MKSRLGFFALSATLLACGDNSNECGEGTVLVDGVCEVDTSNCPDGTVLMDGQCVPEDNITPDIEEGAEPNGLGILEQSAMSAGKINLKAEGEHFVIKGKIEPFRDLDGDGQKDVDVDTYEVEVTGPTLLTVTADGVNGLSAGFVSVANVPSTSVLADWTRYGVNLAGDASQRQLYLPAAGTYHIGVGDTRSLLLTGGAASAAEGKPAFQYYLTVDKTAIPTPTPLTFTDGVATSSGMRAPGEVKLFSAAELGLGINVATLESVSDQVQTSVAVVKLAGTTSTVVGLGDADNSVPEPASVTAVGFRASNTALIVADSVIDYASAPTDYRLTVTTGDAGALPNNNMAVSQPASVTDLSAFYYDVLPDNLLIGMNIAFNRPVSGVVVDENFFIFSLWTFDPDFGFAFGDTFSSYKGHIRHAAPGRYYFLVFDPTFDSTVPPRDLTATSSYGPATTTQLIKGTPITGVAFNATYESNLFTYAPAVGTDPWQSFTATGAIGTGTITLAYANNATAFGRLDPLASGCGSFCDDYPTLFTTTHSATAPMKNRILLDQSAVTTFLVTVNTAGTVAATFDLTAAVVPFNDLGSPAAGATATSNDKPLAGTGVQRYLVRAGSGNRVQINVTPDVAGTDTRVQRVNADESSLGAAINNGAAGAADTFSGYQGTTAWTAFIVSKTGTDGTVDTAFTNLAPITYATATSATAFTDICATGTPVPMSDPDEGRSTAMIATPTGFDFYGFASPELRVFANGFVAFDSTIACGGTCFFNNLDLPGAGAPNGIIAPYWDDLFLDDVCQTVQGSKLIIQWDGTLYDVPEMTVQMQVILDGANDTIEFVYGPGHDASGHGSTSGIENQIGLAAKKLFFNTAHTSVSTTFTPM